MKALILLVAAMGPWISAAGQSAAEVLSAEQAVEFALKNSPTIRAAQAEADAARAETRAARGRAGPQLSANGFAARSSMTNILQSAMGVEPPALALAPEKGFVALNLMLMAPIYTGGYLAGLVMAAQARELAALAESSEMRSQTALMVREAYWRARYGAELAKAQEDRVRAAEAMVRNTIAQLEAGKGIEASVRRAEAELAEARRELRMAENDRRKMLLDLLAEMGADLAKEPSLTDVPIFQPVEGTLAQFLNLAERSRGELVAARERARATKAEVQSREGAAGPQVYGFAMGDTFAPRNEMGKRSGYSVGLTVSVPLFDGGMRRAEAAAARAMQEKAEAEVRRLQLRTEKEVRQAWLDIETAHQNYDAAQAALTAAQSAYEVTVIRVESGKAILVEQLDALAALTRARANLSEAIYEHRIAIARLWRAAGQVSPPPLGGSRL